MILAGGLELQAQEGVLDLQAEEDVLELQAQEHLQAGTLGRVGPLGMRPLAHLPDSGF